MNLEQMQADLTPMTFVTNEPLSHYTFTKTGGPADGLVFPKNRDELQRVVNYCREHGIPWLVLGNASNLIVRDGGIRGVVIMLNEMNQIQVHEQQMIVEAGATLIDTTYEALTHALTGFEFACGIPGSVGGAVYMNAGAYDGEIKEVCTAVEVLLADGTFQVLTQDELQFAYRYSALQEMHAIVVEATFTLAKGEKAAIQARMDELTVLRQSKQPLEYPSCGSVFKRPEGYFTGQLIQQAGLQGLKWGGAQISEKHAGFIVNVDQATATDYIALIAHIQQVIQEQFQVKLETEVRIIGEEK